MPAARTGWILAALAACAGCRNAEIHAIPPAVQRTTRSRDLKVAQTAVARGPATQMPASHRPAPPTAPRSAAEAETGKFAAGLRLVGGSSSTPVAAASTPACRDASSVRPPAEINAAGRNIAQASHEIPDRIVLAESDAPEGKPADVLQPAPAGDTGIPLTLDGAIATALDRNPNLVSLRAGEPVARAVYGVAETYPWNPYVQIEVLPYARDASGNTQAVTNYVLLMQTLEFAHQGRYRKAGAAASLNQVRWNIVQAELTSTAQTERLYFSALYQRDLRDLAARTAALNDELLGIVERRYQANLATPAERTTAQVTARQARKQAALAEANFQTALLTLRRQLNMPTSQVITLIGRLEDFDWLPVTGVQSDDASVAGPIQVSLDVSWQFACERPDVLAAQAGMNVAQSAANLAQANRVPNVQFGPFYERDESATVFAGFRTQMDLPIWNTGRPLAVQRSAEARQQAITTQELRSRAQIEIQTALERYERARRLTEQERPESADTIPDELRRVRELFEEGQADILNVFATQTSLLQEQRTYLDLLNELAQAAADVTLAAGLPPARLVSGQRAPLPVPPAPAPER